MKVVVLACEDKLADAQLQNALTTSGSAPTTVLLDRVPDLSVELARLHQAGYRRALVAGGDGTLHSVIEALVKLPRGERIELGILPMGTGNDFARTIGVAGLDLAAAFRAGVQGTARSVDLGWANAKPFINVASGGAAAQNTTETSSTLKGFLGPLAYALRAITQLADLPVYDIEVEGGGQTIREKCVGFAVANGSTAGGGFQVGPHARVNDGKLDLIVVPQQSLLDLAALAAEVSRAEPDLSKHHLHYIQGPRFSITISPAVQINLDGEPIHGTHFDFRVDRGALDIVFN